MGSIYMSYPLVLKTRITNFWKLYSSRDTFYNHDSNNGERDYRERKITQFSIGYLMHMHIYQAPEDVVFILIGEKFSYSTTWRQMSGNFARESCWKISIKGRYSEDSKEDRNTGCLQVFEKAIGRIECI